MLLRKDLRVEETHVTGQGECKTEPAELKTAFGL
jgi:hypothetical protein